MTMRSIQLVRVAGAALLAASLMAPSPGAAERHRERAPQSDKKMGRWKLRAEGPASGTRLYEDRGCGVTVSVRQGVNSRGQEYYSAYAAKVDGTEYPRHVKSSNGINTIAFTRIDAETVAFTLRQDGKVTSTGTTAVSKDGKVLTVNTKGVDASGRANVEIYDRLP
jgi:hypothetical protein